MNYGGCEENMERTKNALIAMSGGVDSSVAAYLIKSQGFQCEGATMRLYRNEDIGLNQFHTCCSQRDIDDAAEVAFRLDLPYEVLDFTSDFSEKVIQKFVHTYELGETPNPCINCNRYLKFDKLLDTAESKGLFYIVTGHYARVEFDTDSGRYLLKKAVDSGKDQSYVLYSMTQEQLSHTLFPLGTLRKTQVRELASKLKLVTARKHDSQDICFIPDGNYGAFLERYTGKSYSPGAFLDRTGSVIGQHRGAVRYTLGQRKGLGLALGRPVYVCGKNMKDNTVTIGDQDSLLSRELLAQDVNWISVPSLNAPMRIQVKTRYHQPEQLATVFPHGTGEFRLKFDSPQRAVTPGQAVVLYDGDCVVGGGTIKETSDL